MTGAKTPTPEGEPREKSGISRGSEAWTLPRGFNVSSTPSPSVSSQWSDETADTSTSTVVVGLVLSPTLHGLSTANKDIIVLAHPQSWTDWADVVRSAAVDDGPGTLGGVPPPTLYRNTSRSGDDWDDDPGVARDPETESYRLTSGGTSDRTPPRTPPRPGLVETQESCLRQFCSPSDPTL